MKQERGKGRLTRGLRRCGRSGRGRTRRRSTPRPPAATAASGCTCTGPRQPPPPPWGRRRRRRRNPSAAMVGGAPGSDCAQEGGCGMGREGRGGGAGRRRPTRLGFARVSSFLHPVCLARWEYEEIGFHLLNFITIVSQNLNVNLNYSGLW